MPRFVEIESSVRDAIRKYDIENGSNYDSNVNVSENIIYVHFFTRHDPKSHPLYMQVKNSLDKFGESVKIDDEPEREYNQFSFDGGPKKFQFEISLKAT